MDLIWSRQLDSNTTVVEKLSFESSISLLIQTDVVSKFCRLFILTEK